MEREALKMALEALEASAPWVELTNEAITNDRAIADIKEALAQPEQKPAFWLNEQGQLWATQGDSERNSIGQKIIPLYPTPPQRPWVGLTDEEIWALHDGYLNPVEFARAVLAKSKEKNT